MTQEPPPGPPQGWPGQPPSGPSDHPPGHPAGGPPGYPPGGPPGYPPSGPPGYPPSGPPEPRRGMSNGAKFWIGVVLSLPVVFASVMVNAVIGSLFSNLDSTGPIPTLAFLLANGLMFAGWVMALVHPKSRFIALGVLAGAAVGVLLLAGACIALIAGLSSMY